jgi:hypothetical protein
MYFDSLSESNNKVILKWLSKKDKPLFIQGGVGTGKSTLSNKLLQNYSIININSNDIKKKKIKEYIEDSLFKKDILMMCSKKEYKALLIDDINLFVDYDKSNLKLIYKIIKQIDFSKYRTILISNYNDNKYVEMLKKISYNINIGNKQILNKEVELLNVKRDIKFNKIDILRYIFNNEIPINDLFKYVSSEYNNISLNILENISDYLKNKGYIYSIYESICISDYIESKYLENNIYLDVIIFFTCIKPYFYIKNIISKKIKFKHNSYIGRSIIQINNQSLVCNSNIPYLEIIKYLYNLMLTNIKKDVFDPIINSDNFYQKTLEKQIKVFNYYYNKQFTKIQLIKILKLIK